MSTISRPSLKAQAFTDRWQVEIVDLTATYMRNAGMKSAAILDGAEFCRVEEFAARHFRRSGFEATFVESLALNASRFWRPGVLPLRAVVCCCT